MPTPGLPTMADKRNRVLIIQSGPYAGRRLIVDEVDKQDIRMPYIGHRPIIQLVTPPGTLVPDRIPSCSDPEFVDLACPAYWCGSDRHLDLASTYCPNLIGCPRCAEWRFCVRPVKHDPPCADICDLITEG